MRLLTAENASMKITAMLMLSPLVALAQPVQGPSELNQAFLNFGKMPDGSWRHIETLTYTEERGEAGNEHLVQSTIVTAYEIDGVTFEPGAIDAANSYVTFTVDGGCPPYVNCKVPGDFSQFFGADQSGRYYVTRCETRGPDNSCIEVGDNFFFGFSMDQVDELPPPSTSTFTVSPMYPVAWGDSYRGLFGFFTTPAVEVASVIIDVRWSPPYEAPGPVVQVSSKFAHPTDFNVGWHTQQPGITIDWTTVESWCEIVPNVNPYGGHFEHSFTVTAVNAIGQVETQTSAWTDFYIDDCYWAPQDNISDLNGDGSANIFDLGLFRSCFLVVGPCG